MSQHTGRVVEGGVLDGGVLFGEGLERQRRHPRELPLHLHPGQQVAGSGLPGMVLCRACNGHGHDRSHGFKKMAGHEIVTMVMTGQIQMAKSVGYSFS